MTPMKYWLLNFFQRYSWWWKSFFLMNSFAFRSAIFVPTQRRLKKILSKLRWKHCPIVNFILFSPEISLTRFFFFFFRSCRSWNNGTTLFGGYIWIASFHQYSFSLPRLKLSLSILKNFSLHSKMSYSPWMQMLESFKKVQSNRTIKSTIERYYLLLKKVWELIMLQALEEKLSKFVSDISVPRDLVKFVFTLLFFLCFVSFCF